MAASATASTNDPIVICLRAAPANGRRPGKSGRMTRKPASAGISG